MKYSPNNKGLKYNKNTMKIIFVGSLAIVISLLVMSITSINITKKAVLKKLRDSYLNNISSNIGNSIEARLDSAVDISSLLSDNSMLISWLNNGEKTGTIKNMLEKQMKNILTIESYDSVFLASNRTYNYWVHGENLNSHLILDKRRQQDKWFFNAIKRNKKYEITISIDSQFKQSFVYVNVLVGNLKHPLGVTGVGMNLSKVTKRLINNVNSNDLKCDVWLVDRFGKICLSNDKRMFNKTVVNYLPINIVDVIKNYRYYTQKYTVSQYVDNKGKVYDITYKNIRGTDWKVIIRIPRSESLGFMKTVEIETIVACVVIIVIIIIIFITIVFRIANPFKLALILNNELEKSVTQRTRELQEKNQKIIDSLEYASIIQQTIFSSIDDIKKFASDCFIIFDPRDIVSGDFYWVREVKEGYILAVGDCTGHGVPAALMTTAVNAILNSIVSTFLEVDPAEILNGLYRQMKQSYNGENDNLGVQYGLDAAVLYIMNNKQIVFSGAKLSLFVKDDDGLREVKGDRQTIDSNIDGDVNIYTNHVIEYKPDMILYIATDGIMDQPGGPKHLPLGKSHLLLAIENLQHLDMKEQNIKLKEFIYDYYGSEPLRDDITLLGIKL